MRRAYLPGILATALLTACFSSVNSDIHIADGQKRSGSVNTVNGRILVGSGSEVDGSCRTVNGSDPGRGRGPGRQPRHRQRRRQGC